MTQSTLPTTFATIETTVRVRYAETDQSGVVYNANYLIWFELGRGEFFWQRGGDYGKDFEARGLILPVTEAHLRYLAAARYGDKVTIRTTIQDLGSRAITFAYEVINAETGQVLCTGTTRHVCIDPSFRICKFPDDLRRRMIETYGTKTPAS